MAPPMAPTPSPSGTSAPAGMTMTCDDHSFPSPLPFFSPRLVERNPANLALADCRVYSFPSKTSC